MNDRIETSSGADATTDDWIAPISDLVNGVAFAAETASGWLVRTVGTWKRAAAREKTLSAFSRRACSTSAWSGRSEVYQMVTAPGPYREMAAASTSDSRSMASRMTR